MAGEWLNWQQFQQENEPAQQEEQSRRAAAGSSATQTATKGLDTLENTLAQKGGGNVAGTQQFKGIQQQATDFQRQYQHNQLTSPGWDQSGADPSAQQWGDLQKRLGTSQGNVNQAAAGIKSRAASKSPEVSTDIKTTPAADPYQGMNRAMRYARYSDLIQAGVPYAEAVKVLGENQNGNQWNNGES